MYHAYILKSEKDGRYYYGSCADIEKRIAEHNSGKTKSLKGRLPLRLHYSESFKTRGEAYKREKFFKTIAGYHWLKDNHII
ncbi:MAG: GIY-YIG nuclease family protein [Sediminibacterium sp. Gen4]|jgi:putative endonuclease|uniref:GIY-YIG nuclease family protein n=1 Tax=unclassified Sediminibacterium TaxID=2635961 RepID=UPI0015B84FD2|nr:GIY-YIG nuclease family protein [Sediminibacterium sp.]MBW0165252.1 GIY-YIG nuclease family protein [Sediminibacterium sp.]NWK65042.1 GIY-YIG nuclease family protein [Sediminibacterium sp. Gen4]